MEQIQRIVIAYVGLAYCIFIAACLHSVNKSAILLSAVAAVLLFIFSKRLFEQHKPAIPPTDKKHLLCLLCILLPLTHVFFIPPFVRDDIIYHLFAIKRLVTAGGFVFDPYNINTNFPMTFEMPLTIRELFKAPVSPFMLNYLTLALLCVFYFSSARRVFKINSFLSLVAVISVATTPVLYDLLHSCYVEIFMSLLVLIAFTNYIIYVEHNRERGRDWYLTMLFVGFACATKYLGLLYAAYLLCLEFFAAPRRKQYYFGMLICAYNSDMNLC